MKKKLLNHFFPPQEKIKPLLIMKLTLSLIVFTVFQASASIYPQAVKVNVDVHNGTLENVIGQIREQSDYLFVYEVADIKNIGTVSVRMKDAGVEEVLAACLRGSNISFVLKDNTVVLTRARQDTQQPQGRSGILVKGVVTDEQGNPLNGVSVMLKSNASVGTRTNANGSYEIEVPAGGRLRFTYMGMKEQEAAVTSTTTTINIKMSVVARQLEEVAVISTGLFTREKATFTGNVASFSGEELRQVSSRSVLSSLAILDPSFRIMDNIDAGSDPNVLPSVQFRGGSAVNLYAVKDEFSQDPNLPLFILNGVEVSFSRIYDLDPDRIESIHLLKDAGSTAIYGSRGANGVMVVETIKPKVGEYQIYYNGTFGVDAPDLTVYNMMNAAEKLEFEWKSGKFTNVNYPYEEGGATALLEYRKLYNEIQKRIVSGVDTYWLSVPVRTGFSNNHSIRIGGGSEELSLDVSAKFGNTNGVMKNSSRDTWAGSSQIQYRAGKFNITNDTEISGYNAYNSNYGTFDTWVNTSPYYEKNYDEPFLLKSYSVVTNIGTNLTRQIQENNVVNPLWNANLNSKSQSEQLSINNDFAIQYTLNSKFFIRGNFQIRREQEQNTIFKDPEHTDFTDNTYLEKGSYTGKESRSTFYQGQIRANYATTIDGIHNFSAILNTYINQANNSSLTTQAEGFPFGSRGLPSNAHSYKPETSPGHSISKRRQVGVTLTGHYNYLERYLFDVTFQNDGATTFGANNLYQPFWSVGLGWNISRENFTENWDWLDEFRLTGSIGTVGNQSLGQVFSKTVYRSTLEYNVFGQGAYISSIGTPDLPWSIVRKLETNLEFRTWKGRFSMKATYYNHKTDPLIIAVFMKPSTGMKTYPMDIGHSTEQGVEFNISFNPIHRLEDRIYWNIRINGLHYTKKYGGFGDKLAALNELMRESVDFIQYVDGYSEEDIWAVRSYGIDPATGREVFVKKDGKTLTFLYDDRDRVRVGSATPDLFGSIQTTFNYKNLSFSAALSYSIGGDIYNSALYNKVENIQSKDLDKNQDKRALYSRWQQVGDVSQFRSIALITSDNPKTSRFIQRNDYLRGTAFNITYEFAHNEWLNTNLGIRRTQLAFGMDELFRFETSKREIGIEYPYARKFTLKLSLSF